MNDLIAVGNRVLFKVKNCCFLGLVHEYKKYSRKQYLVGFRKYNNPTLFNNSYQFVWIRRKDIISEEKMERVNLCAECGELLGKVALVELLVTYEEDDEAGDIFEQAWHKTCYRAYAKRQEVKSLQGASDDVS
jgi:hypothetical protein